MPLTVLPGQSKSVESNPPIVPNIANLKKKRISWKNIAIGVIVGTVLIGGVLGGWLWYQLDQINRASSNSSTQTTSKTATSSSKVSTPSATTNETAGWKTHTDGTYKFSFKTPKDWVVKEIIRDASSVKLTATSPTGFVLYLELLGGLGGSCGGPEIDKPGFTGNNEYHNLYINAIKAAGFNDLEGNAVEIVERALSGGSFETISTGFKRKDVLLKTKNTGKIGDNGNQCMPPADDNFFINDVAFEVNYGNGNPSNFFFGGRYPDNSKYQQMSLNDYFNLADVETAEKIMSSLKL